MRSFGIFASVAVLVALAQLAVGQPKGAAEPAKGAPHAEKIGWRLGSQAYTFRRGTFFEAVDQIASLGMKYVEMYPGQRVSKEIDAKTDHNMSAETMAKVLAKCKAVGVKPVAYGVVRLPGDEAGCRKVLDWAKKMGIEVITSEPAPEALPMLDKLMAEYDMKLALHNHPKPSRYWNPDVVLAACQGRSGRIGACADTGHWVRSGLDPLECLKKLEGRIVSFHFKDLNKKDRRAHDVPWGTGVNNVPAMLAEIHRQGFRGLFCMEYEAAFDMPMLAQCVAAFDAEAAKFAADEPAAGGGFVPLFAADLSDATIVEGGWTVENGVLAGKKGDIWAKKRYANFVLDLEFKCAENTNSGVMFWAQDIQGMKWVQNAIEIQILQPEIGNPRQNCGGIFDAAAPTKRAIKPAGQWNHYTITVVDSKITVVLNGEQVLDADLNKWTEPRTNPDGTRNKYKAPLKDFKREGRVGLQYHGHPVWFRNVKIKELPKP